MGLRGPASEHDAASLPKSPAKASSALFHGPDESLPRLSCSCSYTLYTLSSRWREETADAYPPCPPLDTILLLPRSTKQAICHVDHLSKELFPPSPFFFREATTSPPSDSEDPRTNFPISPLSTPMSLFRFRTSSPAFSLRFT